MFQIINLEREYFSLYSVGVLPLRRLNTRLKFDRLLKPHL